jgi:hypothetical protein
MTSPSFYLIRPNSATPVSGEIGIQQVEENHAYVCHCPKEGMTVAIYAGTEFNCKRFLAMLLEGLAELHHANFPVVDMRSFAEVGAAND